MLKSKEEYLKQIDSDIESRRVTLLSLTQNLEEVKKKIEEGRKVYQQVIKKGRDEFLEQLSKYEAEIAEPDKTLISIHEDLEEREDRLVSKQIELNKIEKQYQDYNASLIEKEKDLDVIEDAISNIWKELMVLYITRLKIQKETLDSREAYITAKEKELGDKMTRLNDRLRTIENIKRELLAKQNG